METAIYGFSTNFTRKSTRLKEVFSRDEVFDFERTVLGILRDLIMHAHAEIMTFDLEGIF